MQTDLFKLGSHYPQFGRWTSLPVFSCATDSQPERMRVSFVSTKGGSFVQIDNVDGLLLPGTQFYNLLDTNCSEGGWWLNITNPTEAEIGILSTAFSVHPLTTEDIETQETVEKVESFKQYYFCSIRSFHGDDEDGENRLKPTNLYAIVFARGIITFSFGHSEHATNVQKRLGRLGASGPFRANWICYALIDDIIDSFGPLIRQIQHETDAIEDCTFTTPPDDSGPLLRKIYRCRTKIMAVQGLLRNKGSVLKSFARECDELNSTGSHGDIHLYLSDIQDHVATMMADLHHFENMLSRSHMNYLARLSTDGIETRNRTMVVLGWMAVIGAVFFVLNVICGLFGMNVQVPGGDINGLYWWFGILSVILAMMASVTFTVTRVMRAARS